MAEVVKNYLITFKATAMAYKFENYCDQKDIEVKMVPVPSKLSDSCGYACRIHKEDIKKIKNICENKNIDYGDIYKVNKSNEPINK
jgi:ribosomal protein L7Ae-like RNA K-turn-binding protein